MNFPTVRVHLVGLGLLVFLVPVVVPCVGAAEPATNSADAVVRTEFIYETAPFPQCHASTLADTPRGIVAAWFGGTHEKHPDVGIWVARQKGNKWSAPVEVVNGVRDQKTRFPCWNPVLFQAEKGPLLLFYKVGPSPSSWWGMLTTSSDHGLSWGPPRRLPDNIFGPIKNKPVLLDDGRLLCGTSTEDQGWRVHMEWTSDWGQTWSRTGPLNDVAAAEAIQPTILLHEQGLQILCRSRRGGHIVAAGSQNGGANWSQLAPIDLPNPNSGIDAVTLQEGRHLLVYNHTSRGRSPLNVAVSEDGHRWMAALVLEDEPGEYSYPAVIQASDGSVHISYTWRRKLVKHVVVNPAKLKLREIRDGVWPE